jgi:AraC-like DNA-binding protein
MVGVADRRDPSRFVPAQTKFMDVLETDELPQGMFHFITFGSGTIVAEIDDEVCHFSGRSVLCLSERRSFRIRGGHATDVKVVSFSPVFLNVNMTPEFLRKPDYHILCDAHAFFQLSPFLTDDIGKTSFQICEDTYNKFDVAIQSMAQNFACQPDWYWSCRARSHFIDAINILERIYHNYELPALSNDNAYAPKLQREFREMIVYINNHLHEKLTLSILNDMFHLNKNKLEDLFHSYLNESPKEYIDRRRLEEAMYYLRFTSMIGDEIAYRLSFSCAQSFARFFMRMSGQAPEDFRKSNVDKRKANMDELHRLEVDSRSTREVALFG